MHSMRRGMFLRQLQTPQWHELAAPALQPGWSCCCLCSQACCRAWQAVHLNADAGPAHAGLHAQNCFLLQSPAC